MVMDVMAAAARIEAAGGHVIHMEVGPAGGAARRRPRLRPRTPRWHSGRIGYTAALGMPSLRARIATALPRKPIGCAVDAERIVVTTGSSGWLHPGVSADVRAGRPRRGRQCPAIRRIATS